MDRRFEPSGSLRGTLTAPADKSISHRAALIGAMSGEAVIEGFLNANDTRATLAAVRAVGAELEVSPSSERSSRADGLDVVIRGPGLRGASNAEIDVGNAGTLLRLMPGWLAGVEGGSWVFDGDASIRRRPVDRIAEPLGAMGALVECRDGRLPPLHVEGAGLHGVEHQLPISSAQVKSCLLLAGLLADGPTTVIEPAPSRDHTERMLAAAGAALEVGSGRVTIEPGQDIDLGVVEVPGDISSAAFPIVAALLIPGSELEIADVGLNPSRGGLLTVLERMGAELEVEDGPRVAGEPRGTIRARHGDLRGTEIGGDEVPLAIDELPLLALAGCFAEGETVIRDAAELRHKESDRIATVCEGLVALGGDVESSADGMLVRGVGTLRGGTIDSHGDHRLALLGAVAGLASREGVTVRGFDAAEVSYPGFESSLAVLTGG
jgi:3-phosphoshikimate 1-carboxyvinyltransferase